jgi:hypothetical protein
MDDGQSTKLPYDPIREKWEKSLSFYAKSIFHNYLTNNGWHKLFDQVKAMDLQILQVSK